MATPEPSTNCLCSTAKFIGKHAWGCCENLIKLDQNVDKLKGDTEYLRSQMVDINAKLRAEDLARKIKKKEVETWLGDADCTIKDMEEFQGKVDGSKNNIVKRFWLAQQIQCKIDKVAEVEKRGIFPDGLVIDAPPPKGMLFPMEPFVSEAASARNFKKVWNCLIDGKFTKIGVVGMGGAGKTTIMKQIHNEMIKGTGDYFDKVIWVTVSKGLNVEKIQDTLARELYPKEVDYDNWKSMDEMERIRELCTILFQKRYLLLLDDVWETFGLDKVGVPNLSNITVVLTTRLKEVSKKMGCEIVEVDLLTDQEAKDLFFETIALNVNELPPKVKNIVEIVIEKCAHLPLAIMTISRNMRRTEDIYAWKKQLTLISLKEIKDDERNVLEVLRYSYDRLEDKKLQKCFLYCALYPEDHNIPKNELIEYWIVEGFIDEADGREAMFDEGHCILNKLIDTNLLERAHGECVRVHDLIREMSLKMIGTRFYSGGQLFEEAPFEVWSQDREKVFLGENRIRDLPSSPLCPQLTTLVLRGSDFLDSIPDSIFSNMPRLKVLDLSYTRIQSLPESISNLESLHALLAGYCRELEYMPSLEKLKELKELILCDSKISEVPGLEELVNLRNLDLFRTWKLGSFDSSKLCRLSKLQRLRIDGSKMKVSAEDLLCLNKLEVVGAEFQNGQELISYLNSPQCQRLKKYCLYVESNVNLSWGDFEKTGNEFGVVGPLATVVGREVFPSNVESLHIEGCKFDIKIRSSGIMPWKNAKDLRKFSLKECKGIELIFSTPSSSSSENCQTPLRSVEKLELHWLDDLRVLFHEVAPAGDISFKLRSLTINGCSGIKNIFPAMLLQKNFPNLEELHVSNCENVKEIIIDEDVEMSRKTITLPNRMGMSLSYLPALESIYKGTTVSTSLNFILVEECPKLKRLPFSCSHTDDCQQHASPAPAFPLIQGEKEWWESLEWDDDHTETAFYVFFL